MFEPDLIEEVPTLLVDEPLVLALDNWNQPKHYWHLIVWSENQRGKGGQFTDERIDDIVKTAESRLAKICAQFCRKFAEEGIGEDRSHHYWRANRKNDRDEVRLYITGALPPRIFCRSDGNHLPDDSQELIELSTEVIEWLDTPAARGYGIDIESLRQHNRQLIDSCQKEIESFAAMKRAKAREDQSRAVYESLLRKKESSEWLQAAFVSGRAAKWCDEYGLAKLRSFLGQVAQQKVKPVSFWSELGKADSDLQLLESVLLAVSPSDSAAVARLRETVKDEKFRPFGTA